MKPDEIVSKSQLKRIEMQKESREKMKQNEVLEQLKLLKGGATHKNTPYFRALTEAIRCVEENEKQKELIAVLVEALELSKAMILCLFGDMKINPDNNYYVIDKMLEKAKELSK